MSTDGTLPEVFVARQPIYTRDLEVFGYELLFRGSASAEASDVDSADPHGSAASTGQVMLASFLEIGLDRLVGRHMAFVNFTRAFLVGEHSMPFQPESLVVEVLEDVPPDPLVMAGLRELAREGFLIALDDYVHSDEMVPLLDIANIVKLDVQALGPEEVRRHVHLLAPHGVKLLAEKVETVEELDRYLELGLDYFQGYFLTRPVIVSGRRIPTNRVGLVRLLAGLQDPELEVDELLELVREDVTLSARLLRYANSALLSLPREIEDVREVLMLLGVRKVREIVNLLLLSRIDDRPTDLISISLYRAKMSELMAAGLPGASAHACFTAGLFSSLDALLGVALDEVLAELPLADDIRAAILRQEGGATGRALRCALGAERGDWDVARREGVGPTLVRRSYLDAVRFADGVMEELRGWTG